MLLTLEGVKKILPHREPFLFIDSVVSVKSNDLPIDDKGIVVGNDTTGASIEALYFTRPEHSIFAGHFPGNPILPGVVQLEMMAQATVFVSMIKNEHPFAIDLGVALMGVENARFRRPVTPNMQLTIHSTIVRTRGNIIHSQCEVHHEGKILSQAKIMATLEMKFRTHQTEA